MSTETQQAEFVAIEQALEALDEMDDFARMDVSVDAIGPRGVLERFIEQQSSQAAEMAALKADIAEHVRITAEQATEIEALRSTQAKAVEDERRACAAVCFATHEARAKLGLKTGYNAIMQCVDAILARGAAAMQTKEAS